MLQVENSLEGDILKWDKFNDSDRMTYQVKSHELCPTQTQMTERLAL